jgi:hypothetical protein
MTNDNSSNNNTVIIIIDNDRGVGEIKLVVYYIIIVWVLNNRNHINPQASIDRTGSISIRV